ncbi:DUF2339 domain-containing protein, partial [bacterium]|nr:DUF2339 domain-containing protein [bacterium]
MKPDSIENLRKELDYLSRQIAFLSDRLNGLEKREAEETAAPSVVEQEMPATPPEPVQTEPGERPEPARPAQWQRPAASAPPFASSSPEEVPPERKGITSRLIEKKVEEFRTRIREQGWEVSVGTYLLPRIAIALIAIAVVFFLSLAISTLNSQWAPHFRVGVGYLVTAGLLILAWRQEKTHPPLSKVLYAGGFGLLYFVTFSTYYIPFARIFVSPVWTLLLLGLIVLVWGAAAQVRRSQTIAVLVTVLGHLTVGLSSGTIDPPNAASVVGVVALSVGSAFFLLRNGWYYVASLGILGSYINQALYMHYSPSYDTVPVFVMAMSVLVIYFRKPLATRRNCFAFPAFSHSFLVFWHVTCT